MQLQQNPIPATQEMLSGLAEEKLSQWQLSREKQYIILSSDTKPSEVTKAWRILALILAAYL